MRRLISLLGLLAIVLGVGGSASAGYWEVTYDLTGSTSATIVTVTATTDIDPITGSFTVQYDGPQAGPVTGARLVAGHSQVVMSQTNLGLFLLTGTTDSYISPPAPGISGAISAPNVLFPPIATTDLTVTGFIHCYNGAFNCTAAGTAFVHSVPVAQVTLGPLSIGPFVFTGGVGTTDFTAVATQTVPQTPPVTVVNTYVGKEIARVWVGPVPAVSSAGRVGLALALVLGGASVVVLRRGRRSRSAG